MMAVRTMEQAGQDPGGSCGLFYTRCVPPAQD